jgi:hypothetical protein
MAMTASITTTNNPRTVKVLIWTVTEPLANSLFFWSNALLIVGAAAVLIGTIGAIGMGAAKEQFSNERIAANESLTALANAEAEKAKEGSAQANKAASEARLAAVEANERVAAANERAAALEKEAAEFKAEAASLRAGLAQRMPRTISESQQRELIAVLSPGNVPKGKVLINSAYMDAEASRFGDQITDVLKRCGFDAEPISPQKRALTFNTPGLFFSVRDGKNAPRFAKPILDAFGRVGIEMSVYADPKEVPDDVTVIIGVSSHP